MRTRTFPRICALRPAIAGLLLFAASAGAHAVPTQTLSVDGLRQPAQILVDRWGVPHIYAESQDDVFFAQGFNAARDRLFQIDLWRRRGLGELASVFGPSYVEQDKAARLFLYRGDMHKEWRSYGKGAQRITERFVAGINAYVDYVARKPELLPFEFRQLRYLPAKWRAEDVVRIRSHGLTRNLTSEVARANMACMDSLDSDQVRARITPAWEVKLPQGLDPCLPSDLLKVFTLATQNAWFDNNTLRSAGAGVAPPALASALPDPDRMEGSNNWVIAPSKSATGRPIMANDPHRAYSAPSLRYIAHLSAPGLDVIGAGEPALPGISIGHNGTIAFGLTIFSIDQEDLYVYELNPLNLGEYRYKGGWEKLRVVRETIEVRGAQPVEAELVFTRHGPVIYSEPQKKRAFAVRSGWMEAGMAPYFGSIDYMQAKDFAQFKRAMLHWGAPTENQVYADTKGNIGWVPGGLTPIRPNWDGLLPVPGDGRYEWDGFLAGDKLPSAFNPSEGWFASANELNLPPDYPYAKHKLGFEWPSNSRYTRISEVLSRSPKVSIEDSMRLQNDVLSVPARRMARLLKRLRGKDMRAQSAIKLLTSWDFVQHANSPQAALFEVWWARHLAPAFMREVLDKGAAAMISKPDVAGMLASLELADGRFGSDGKNRRDRVLLDSLAGAYAEMEQVQGADPKAWRWGALHYTYFAHPLSIVGDGSLRSKLNVGPFPRQGSANTVNQSSYRPEDFLQINGPSFRVVVDVGNWDNSRAINTPGQSGDPDSPHYRDLAGKWVKGEYFPLAYSRKSVEAAATQRIVLQPAK